MKLLKVSALVVIALLLGTSQAARQQGGAVAKKLAQYSEPTVNTLAETEGVVADPNFNCECDPCTTLDGDYVRSHKNGLQASSLHRCATEDDKICEQEATICKSGCSHDKTNSWGCGCRVKSLCLNGSIDYNTHTKTNECVEEKCDRTAERTACECTLNTIDVDNEHCPCPCLCLDVCHGNIDPRIGSTTP